MAGGRLYFMTNQRNGVLYAGVISNLPRRAYDQSRQDEIGDLPGIEALFSALTIPSNLLNISGASNV
jgi:hypothetical protein